MWWTLGISAVVGLLAIAAWYGGCVRWNRRRAEKLLRSIESAFMGYGTVNCHQWVSASEFHVDLRLANCAFKHPNIIVKMLPREMPLNWLISRVRKQHETLTFEANLLCPPGFNLEVHNQRWWARTRRRMPKKDSIIRLKHIGPFILTSRRDWEREITSMVHALSASRDCDLLSVSFRRSEPHFSATILLNSMEEQNCSPVRMFDALRELASGASAARF